MALTGHRLGVVARNRIGPKQERKALEDIVHFDRGQNADPVDEPRAIDGPDLGHVYNTGTRKSCLTSSQAHIARHGSKPEVRRDCRDDRGGDGASIETVVLYDESGPAPSGC